MRTVPVSEAPYCHRCPKFTPEIRTAKCYADSAEYLDVNEIVCANADLCRHLFKRFKEIEGRGRE